MLIPAQHEVRMNIRLQVPTVTDLKPRITVIGVGGAGGNAINNMIASGLDGVEFVVANTDAQALATSSAERRVQLGVHLTEGLGAGSKPEIGEAAAEEAIEEIRAAVVGSHMVFVACGMGGGTGSGAAAVIARIAKEMGILVVGVVTKPFTFEGSRRMRIAEAGVAELGQYVDTLIVIPNQNLFRVANEKTTFADAFLRADQVLYSGIACIVDLIVKEGLINLDFADVRTVMSGMGTAMMGTGEGTGERRAIQAAEEAISNPLLDDISLRGAKGLLLSIIGGRNLTLYEVDEAASRVREEVDAEANIIVGATFDDSLGDRVRVSIVASGMARTLGQGATRPNSGYTAPAVRQPPLPQSAPVLASVTTAPMPYQQPQLPVQPPQAYQPGTSGVPPQVSSGTQNPIAAPQPFVPAGQHGARPADLARLLSDALDQADDSQLDVAAEAWSAPGDVRIQPGLAPGLVSGLNVNHTPSSTSQPQQTIPQQRVDQEPFRPMPPQDLKRPAAKRMPELEEFPLVAQREYREHQARNQTVQPPVQVPGLAAASMPHQPPTPHHGLNQSSPPAGPRVYTPPPVSAQAAPARKLGLFERLTGKGRKGDESVDFGTNRTPPSNLIQQGPVSGQINAPQPALQVVVNDGASQDHGRAQRSDNKQLYGRE
jgi:cell division protein FtsZ